MEGARCTHRTKNRMDFLELNFQCWKEGAPKTFSLLFPLSRMLFPRSLSGCPFSTKMPSTQRINPSLPPSSNSLLPFSSTSLTVSLHTICLSIICATTHPPPPQAHNTECLPKILSHLELCVKNILLGLSPKNSDSEIVGWGQGCLNKPSQRF